MAPECCKSIYLSGGGVDASKILEERVGKYSNLSFGPTGHQLYVRIGSSTNSSIVYGDEKGWRLYNGIETNPNYAGSGLIKFGCSSKCPVDCDTSKYKFWNKNTENFEIDSSLTIKCTGAGDAISPLEVGIVLLTLLTILILFIVLYIIWRWIQQRNRLRTSNVEPGLSYPKNDNIPLIVDTSPHISVQGHSKDETFELDDNACQFLEGIEVQDIKNSRKFMCINAKEGARIWLDNDSTIKKLPSFLQNSHLFQLPYQITEKNPRFFISSTGNEDLYVCTATDNRRGWFSNTLSSAPNFFHKREETLSNSNGNLLIFEKKNFSFISLPPTETDILVFAIFIKKSR